MAYVACKTHPVRCTDDIHFLQLPLPLRFPTTLTPLFNSTAAAFFKDSPLSKKNVHEQPHVTFDVQLPTNISKHLET